jgi:hypothetical protein
MLRAGASLPEVGQVLRHASVLTTAIYAKVDRGRLRSLALPWPGGGVMSNLRAELDHYLAIRRSLGFKLRREVERLRHEVAALRESVEAILAL